MRDRNIYAKEQDERTAACRPIDLANKATMPAIRQCLAEKFYKSSLYRAMEADFPTRMEPKVIAGMYTDVFTPASGVADENRKRILIDLHAGALMWESKTFGYLGDPHRGVRQDQSD